MHSLPDVLGGVENVVEDVMLFLLYLILEALGIWSAIRWVLYCLAWVLAFAGIFKLISTQSVLAVMSHDEFRSVQTITHLYAEKNHCYEWRVSGLIVSKILVRLHKDGVVDAQEIFEACPNCGGVHLEVMYRLNCRADRISISKPRYALTQVTQPQTAMSRAFSMLVYSASKKSCAKVIDGRPSGNASLLPKMSATNSVFVNAEKSSSAVRLTSSARFRSSASLAAKKSVAVFSSCVGRCFAALTSIFSSRIRLSAFGVNSRRIVLII